MRRLHFGIDVGGTFTDLVAYDETSGRLRSLKVPTDPDRQERGLLAGIASLLAGSSTDSGQTGQVASIVHGTTVVTNAILEGRIAKVALVTTRGFRDVLEIGRQSRDSLYQLDRPGRPEPLVPRHRRFEVDERVAFDGRVLRELSVDSLRAVVEQVHASGAEAVAVCLLHAYANPDHERAVRAALEALGRYVCASSEINAEFREYERTSTAVLNAAVMPLVDRYLADLSTELAVLDAQPALRIVQSSGGMMSSQVARRLPVRMVMSGPAAGVAAAQYLTRQLGVADAVTFDMGGTSTDVCLIAGGLLETVRERKLGGRPLRIPSVAVESIGAGGGSVAWLDPTGALKVGPSSAGASPGPAAYGRGGTKPTVTDANVVLGYIRPGLVFGGAIRIDRGPAEVAVARLGAALGLSPLATAQGIVQIADASMMQALRLVSVQKGYDLRSFTLVAYGGAGPLHAGRLAQALGIPRVVIPADSSVFSAFGCLVSDVRYDAVQTYRTSLGALDLSQMEEHFRRLEVETATPLLAEGFAPAEIVLRRSLDLRYSGQNYELEVPLGDGRETLDPLRIRGDFNTLHQGRYTYSTDEEVECVNLRLVASVESRVRPEPRVLSPRSSIPSSKAREWTEAAFAETGLTRVPVYQRSDIGSEPIHGPAIAEDEHATIVIFPGQQATADRFGNLQLETAG